MWKHSEQEGRSSGGKTLRLNIEGSLNILDQGKAVWWIHARLLAKDDFTLEVNARVIETILGKEESLDEGSLVWLFGWGMQDPG